MARPLPSGRAGLKKRMVDPRRVQIGQRAPAIDDCAEQLRGAFGVVNRRVSFSSVPLDACGLNRAAQNGLPQRESREGRCVEAAEGVERVALVAGSLDRRIQESEVERCVVADKNRALTSVALQSLADRHEKVVERRAFVHCCSKRMVDVYAGDFERFGIDLRARERDHVRRNHCSGEHPTFAIHLDGRSSDFKQRVALGVETTRLDIDDDWKKTAKALRHRASWKENHGCVRFQREAVGLNDVEDSSSHWRRRSDSTRKAVCECACPLRRPGLDFAWKTLSCVERTLDGACVRPGVSSALPEPIRWRRCRSLGYVSAVREGGRRVPSGVPAACVAGPVRRAPAVLDVHIALQEDEAMKLAATNVRAPGPNAGEGVGAGFDAHALLLAREHSIEATRRIAEAIRPGMTEQEAVHIADGVFADLGFERLWHPTHIRFGRNTLKLYKEASEPDVVLGACDLFFIDIGPVWGGHEGDYGDTFVVGDDPTMIGIARAARDIFADVAQRWRAGANGRALYEYAESAASARGYVLNLGAPGHRLGDFPHAVHKAGKLAAADFKPSSGLWVLEIQIRHPELPLGAFYEDLLLG